MCLMLWKIVSAYILSFLVPETALCWKVDAFDGQLPHRPFSAPNSAHSSSECAVQPNCHPYRSSFFVFVCTLSFVAPIVNFHQIDSTFSSAVMGKPLQLRGWNRSTFVANDNNSSQWISVEGGLGLNAYRGPLLHNGTITEKVDQNLKLFFYIFVPK